MPSIPLCVSCGLHGLSWDYHCCRCYRLRIDVRMILERRKLYEPLPASPGAITGDCIVSGEKEPVNVHESSDPAIGSDCASSLNGY